MNRAIESRSQQLPVRTAYDQRVQPPDDVRWTERVLEGRPARAAGWALIGCALGVSTALLTRDWLAGAIAVVAMLAVTTDAWAGCECSVSASGVERRGRFRARRLSWQEVSRVAVTPLGATFARANGRGSVSFHLNGLPPERRACVSAAVLAWRDWCVSRSASG